MIKVSDLRVGNIVSNGDPVILKFYMLNSMLDGDYVDYDPIELDEEWCRKFGLGKENGYPYKFHYGYLKMRNGSFFYKYFDIEIELQFVHQLQNLYYCLTGKELETVK